MRKVFLLTFLFNFLQIVVVAQTEHLPCPALFVEEPGLAVKPFEDVQFSVRFDKNFDTSNLKFFWVISSGKIIKGQETSSIIVKQTDIGGNGLTATIRLKGLPPECNSTASGSAPPWDPPPITLVDEYSKISPKEETARLEIFAKNLQNDPTATALIIKSFPPSTSRKKVSLKLQKVLENLENFWIDENKISFGITYSNKDKTTLWLIPAGADMPGFKGRILSANKLEEILNKKHKK